MSKITRRDFVKGSIAAMATITVAGTKSSGRVLGANDTVRVAVAGLNGRGGSHVGAFGPMQDVQVTYLVDPDTRRAGYGRRLLEAGEAWARSMGYAEMASDALLDNLVSHEAHKRSGYIEVDRVVIFRKPLL